ncbi:FAD-binding-domain-containing protein [Aspergillus terreus]|uniref:FAD-binding-domain-containing protein n=1 Tax=Aspergillus terreus TaxID=33178 RepID=A0A5M3YLR1_ASPTE|nr:hypothetical protein ATETN484_0001049900 [Aspergillus terreus]GFF12355.1 FAD-binding-domain-containing protein [Aspergillus terreus]
MRLAPLRLLGLTVAVLTPTQAWNICRCRIGEPCWPSQAEWRALNASVNGNLIAVRPVGDVCYGSAYDAAKCEEVRSRTNDAAWRVAQPGALSWTNWEALPDLDEDCYIDRPRNHTCKQGRIPPYAVMARTPRDIQEALRFAKRRNIHVVVRNTGHDMFGKSGGPSALQINLSKLKGVQYQEHFVPRGGSQSLGKAATLAAGTMGAEFAEDARKHGYVPLIGLAPTVGVAGGFLQGGGISTLTAVFGLAADHALEFEVITAQGDLVVANEFQNQDLFWALKGGGGGTFGIAIRSTVQVFDDFPALTYVAAMSVPDAFHNGSAADCRALWDVVEQLIRLIPRLHDKNVAANFGMTHMPDDSAMVTMQMVFANRTTAQAKDDALADLYAVLREHEIPYNATSNVLTGYSQGLQRPTDRTGWADYDGSVLLSRRFLSKPNAPSRMVEVMSQVKLGVGHSFEIDMLGGRVLDKNQRGSALHPSWRESLALLIIHMNLSPSPTPEMQRQAQVHLTNVHMPLFRSIEGDPQMGSYSNAADPYEPHFQQAFWGANYPRLAQVKRLWDRDEVFVSRTTVGSEGWDVEGLCRTRAG